MHYFDENDIKKLQKIENEIVLSIIYKRKKKSLFNKIKKFWVDINSTSDS